MKLLHIGLLTACGLVTARGLAQVPLNRVPTRVVGHLRNVITSVEPNLVEGRELQRPQAVAIDPSSGALYVADLDNNRVLGWRSASGFENGAAADVVVGQRDLFSTGALGPGSNLLSGLSRPTGLVVDTSGNLYVADAANNRILRFPRPFDQTDAVKIPDLVIGQTSLNSRATNAGGLSARSIFSASVTSSSTTVFRVTLQFDSQGNLWFTDAGNHRVLRYPASVLGTGATNGPNADLVLGQQDFISRVTLAPSPAFATRRNKQVMNTPAGLAFDRSGRLFVPDGYSRVLVYVPPFRTGMDAARVMGLPPLLAPGQTPPPPINEYTLGVIIPSPLAILAPEGVFTIGNTPFVVDTYVHRILRYDPYDTWPAETETALSPPAKAVIGQDGFTGNQQLPNRGRAEPAANTFLGPLSAAYANGEVYVVDSANHRVLVFPDLSSGPSVAVATPYQALRVLGQVGFDLRSPNLIDGREFNTPGGVVLDTRSSPPRLYVADTLNHRVLGFADSRKVRPGDKADLVIGQPDLFRSLANYPSNDSTKPTDTSLFAPLSLAVDSDGNLYVADTGNSRVLRFPRPFSQQGMPAADLVIGQSSFTTRITDATSRTMAAPSGLAFTVEGSLLVSDIAHNRVLLFRAPFSNGMEATNVVGQPDFLRTLPGREDNRLDNPRHIAVDTDDRLYVCDTSNRRVLIFRRATTVQPDERAAFTIPGVGVPVGIYVSPATGEIWITDGAGSRALRFPRYDLLLAGANRFDYEIPSPGPLGVAQDGFGNLYLSDSSHRVAIYFPAVEVMNAANFLNRLSPGMYTTLKSNRLNYRFTEQTKVFDELPDPIPMTRTLADLQVVINDEPIPIHFVSPEQINFLMPMSLAAPGRHELVVFQVSTSRIVAATQMLLDVSSPGLFAIGPAGSGQLAAINQDGTVNSASNAIARGGVVTLFGTGQGFVPGAPGDGRPVEGVLETPDKPRVIVNARFLDEKTEVLYSGFAPGAIGLWQINIKIPDATPPGNAIQVVVVMRDIPSNNPAAPNQIRTTIAVKQ